MAHSNARPQQCAHSGPSHVEAGDGTARQSSPQHHPTFVSEFEDKLWFNDREMWPAYLTMVASERFNLSVGIGCDFLREMTDAYLLFAYPFLLDVAGYTVRAAGLPDAERDRN